jgi:hypothetical protein
VCVCVCVCVCVNQTAIFQAKSEFLILINELYLS